MTQMTGKIAVLSSGGDAPGMNACIRAIVRAAHAHELEVLGVRNGFQGLIEGEFIPLSLRSVGNIIQKGGTILGTSRSKEFSSSKGRKKAYEQLRELEIDKLIVLGGDGTMAGAGFFSEEYPVCVVGVPCTIDNDLHGTDLSIGFDTAVQTAVDCIDKIRDTADSHGRLFIVEVMGKNTGHIAIETGLAVGAEYVIIPERKYRSTDLLRKIQKGIERGKTGSIVIVAEGKSPGQALVIAEQLQRKVKRELRTLILGHLQRGGSPSRTDRNLASQFGAFAVELAIQGKNKKMTAISCGKMIAVDFSTVLSQTQRVSFEKLKLIDILSV